MENGSPSGTPRATRPQWTFDDYKRTTDRIVRVFGLSFQRLSKKSVRQAKARNGKRMFNAADATRDFPAVRMIMGHRDESIDAHYREHIDDDRLKAVTSYVHTWLFGDEDGTE